jgi:AcrR family transcriptional regulator
VRRLVDAALILIQRTGELEPRVSEIVREAGLHNQAFYRHFRSKHELLVAVLDEGIRGLAGYLARRMASEASPRARVRVWLQGILEQAIDPRGAEATRPFAVARGRLADAFPEEVRESERQLTRLVREAIAEGVAQGDFPGADPGRDAETLYLLAMGWVEHRLTDVDPAAPEDARALETFALAGLSRGADAEAPPA